MYNKLTCHLSWDQIVTRKPTLHFHYFSDRASVFNVLCQNYRDGSAMSDLHTRREPYRAGQALSDKQRHFIAGVIA